VKVEGDSVARVDFRIPIFPKIGILTPSSSRRSLDIRPGQKVQVICYGDRIELIPLSPVQELRGFLNGIDTTVQREPDRV
jgi:bifunctional DNA-binding transcriptional regulator/antitoxin component of YhaV-PrlF toxin-antitoxin module